MSNSGRRASVRCPPPGHHQKKEPAVRRSAIALRTPADAFVANLATKCAAAAARSPDPVPTAALRNGCYAPARRTLARRRTGAGRRGRFGTFRAEPALAYTLYERQPTAGAHRGAHHAEALASDSARLSAVRVSWKAHGVHQGHLALNGSRPCSIPGECLRQGQRREPQLIGPSASSADGSKVRTVVLRRITPGPFASFLLAFWRPVARDLALHGGCEQCDA